MAANLANKLQIKTRKRNTHVKDKRKRHKVKFSVALVGEVVKIGKFSPLLTHLGGEKPGKHDFLLKKKNNIYSYKHIHIYTHI